MGAARRVREAVANADPSERRALGLSIAALLLAGLPILGLVVSVVAVVVAQRVRRAGVGAAGSAGEPSRLAVVAVLFGTLGLLLSLGFTALFVLLVQLG